MTGRDHIGTYRRELPVTLERLYENAIDWEHLPYLHKSSFARIECVQSDPAGFRAWVWPRRRPEGPPILLALSLDRTSRGWISRTIEGPGARSEIRTSAFPLAERRTEVVVDFFVPDIASERVEEMRTFYVRLYARLYDEDVSMMTLRQARLDAIRQSRGDMHSGTRTLGPLAEVRKRLPVMIDAPDGSKFILVNLNDQLVAYPTVCPHLLGPLDQGAVDAGIVECPWHGYRFDLRTGSCVRGGKCSLPPPPAITIDSQTTEVRLEWRSRKADSIDGIRESR